MVSGTLKAGDLVDMWVRATIGFQKINDNWLITHEHSSVPLNMETDKGEFVLRP